MAGSLPVWAVIMAAVANARLELTSSLSRRAVWDASASGTYFVYVNGFRVGATAMTFWDVTARDGESVLIEVFDDAADRPGTGFPNWAVLGWDNPLVKGSPIAAQHYRIEQYVTDAWVLRQRIQDSGLPYYSWPTPVMTDCTVHQWRIVPVAASGAEGLALEFSILMVRFPAPPEATYTLGANGVVTVG